MRISTWNVERLKHRKAAGEIVEICEQLHSDILVLTETDEQAHPKYDYSFHSLKPIDDGLVKYNYTENRVSIYTNFNCIRQFETYDSHTAVCVMLDTPYGELIVYGTIMGIYGNRHVSYMEDLKRQIDDFTRLISVGKPICICGDFNCSFSDNYYFTKNGRDTIRKYFVENDINLITGVRSECIDHIAISDTFIAGSEVLISEWNYNKALSDHKGISVLIKDGK